MSTLTPPEASRFWRAAAFALIGALLIALCARWSFTLPTGAVPQTLQTAAVLAIGMVFGPWVGLASVAIYVAAGVFGLPVFADGAFGWAHASGPSLGYLVGFALAATMAGYLTRDVHQRNIVGWFTTGLLGHVVILGAGWLGLLRFTSAGAAWDNGVSPYGDGAVVKSLLLAVIVLVATIVRAPGDADAVD